MLTKFDDIIDVVLEHEGGYVNDPNDLGGETKYGITKRFYPDVDIKNLTEDEARKIYYDDYWVKNKVPQLPDNLKYDQDKKLGKVLLQKILQKYGMDTFVTKEKQGFSVNTQNLWKKYGQKLCMYFLDESRIIRDGWINSEWVSKYIDNKDLEARYVNKFLGLLAFEIWYRIFITKEMSYDEKLKI